MMQWRTGSLKKIITSYPSIYTWLLKLSQIFLSHRSLLPRRPLETYVWCLVEYSFYLMGWWFFSNHNQQSLRDGVSIKLLFPITILGYPRDFLKYKFDAWWGIVNISWAGELLFSLGWQSATDGVSTNILVTITILDWCQEWHPVITFCHIWIY